MTCNCSSSKASNLQFTDQWHESFRAKAAFAKVRKAETDYALRLRKVVQHIHDLITEFVTTLPGFPVDLAHLEGLLTRYANLIEPWARAVATRFLAEVARRDDRAWRTYSTLFSRALEQQIRSAPVGEALHQFLETQVQLITSLPIGAAQRVHEIAIGNLFSGARASELADHILETSEVTRNRAMLIARTETARVSSTLTMVRAKHIGSEKYIWRTVRDSRVRDSHHAMEGVVVDWDMPPEVEPNRRYHAGMTYNCRCFPEPIIPDYYLPG